MERLFQYGVLGVLVVVFGLTIWYLWREWREERKALGERIETLHTTHETKLGELRKDYDDKLDAIWKLRLEDAKAYQAQFTDLTKQSITMLTNVANLLETNKETMSDLKETMREVSDSIRASRRAP